MHFEYTTLSRLLQMRQAALAGGVSSGLLLWYNECGRDAHILESRLERNGLEKVLFSHSPSSWAKPNCAHSPPASMPGAHFGTKALGALGDE
jgi:hypothetical protein